jgi:hypothetical protein
VAGEQEEANGVIEDFTLTASNFTEHVWALKIIAADVANEDLLEFRVTLNGGAPGLTNSVTPSILVSVAPTGTVVVTEADDTSTASGAILVTGTTNIPRLNDSFNDAETNGFTLNSTFLYAGQSFTAGQAGDLLTARFWLHVISGSPTGNIRAELYVLDVSGVPTGAAVATSANFDVSTLTGSSAPIDFTFSDGYDVAAGTRYGLVVGPGDGFTPGAVLGVRGNNVSGAGHSGARLFNNGSWATNVGSDIHFEAYTLSGPLEGNDTSSIAAIITITGAVSVTEALDTSSVAAVITVTGTVARTEEEDLSSATGIVTGASITGTSTVTEQDDTSDATGTRSFQGTIEVTEETDTSSASGIVLLYGTTTNAEGDDTSTASGIVLVTGTIEQIEATDTSNISALVVVTGTIARTEEADTSDASGNIPIPITGTSAATEQEDTSTITALVIITGTLAQTEAADISTASGFKLYVGTVAATEIADTSSIVALVRVSGTIAQIEALDTSNATGIVLFPITGTISVTEQNDTSVITAVIPEAPGSPQKKQQRRRARGKIKTKTRWDLWSKLTVKVKITGPVATWTPAPTLQQQPQLLLQETPPPPPPPPHVNAKVRINQGEESLDALRVQSVLFLYGRVELRQWPLEDDRIRMNLRLVHPHVHASVRGGGGHETLVSTLHSSSKVTDLFLEDVINLIGSIPADELLLVEMDDVTLVMDEEEIV